MSLYRAMDEIDNQQFIWWCAYQDITGSMLPTQDTQMAELLALIYTYLSKPGTSYSPADFLPRWDDTPPVKQAGYISQPDPPEIIQRNLTLMLGIHPSQQKKASA